MGCFSARLMSAASDQKLFCKLCSPFCCSFDEFVEEKVISPSYSSAILTPRDSVFVEGLVGRVENPVEFGNQKIMVASGGQLCDFL